MKTFRIFAAIIISTTMLTCNVQASERLERSQNRIVVTERGKTYSLPAPKGSGKSFISSGRSTNEITRDARKANSRIDDHKKDRSGGKGRKG